MKRLVFAALFSLSLLLASCDCDPQTQPCDADLSTRKPSAPQEAQNCEWVNGSWFCQ